MLNPRKDQQGAAQLFLCLPFSILFSLCFSLFLSSLFIFRCRFSQATTAFVPQGFYRLSRISIANLRPLNDGAAPSGVTFVTLRRCLLNMLIQQANKGLFCWCLRGGGGVESVQSSRNQHEGSFVCVVCVCVRVLGLQGSCLLRKQGSAVYFCPKTLHA